MRKQVPLALVVIRDAAPEHRCPQSVEAAEEAPQQPTASPLQIALEEQGSTFDAARRWQSHDATDRPRDAFGTA